MPPSPKRAPRKDPENQRMASLAFDATRLDPNTTDPNRVYRFASHTASNMGVQQRLELGWKVEVKGQGSPRLVIGTVSKDGEPITYKGQVLMSIERQRYEEAEQYGWYGESGQNMLDQLSRRVRRTGGIESSGAPIPASHVRLTTTVDGHTSHAGMED